MCIVFNCPVGVDGSVAETASKVRGILETAADGRHLHCTKSHEEVLRLLNEEEQPARAAVFLVTDRQQLLELMLMRDLLKQRVTVFILPDANLETISLAQVFRPRLLLCAQGDLEEIGRVASSAFDGHS